MKCWRVEDIDRLIEWTDIWGTAGAIRLSDRVTVIVLDIMLDFSILFQ